MNREKILTSEQIRKILDVSANKNNNLLIFFFTFGLYILISTLGTTDVALLLPKQGFKMPIIDFELDLLSFFAIGPSLLLLFHFNLLFSHHKHLEKLHTYKNKVDINSIDPSLYSFAFMMGNHGFSGRMINLTLWLLLYILPLLVFLIIYIRFADYHHGSITLLHLGIIILDLIFIISSIIYNDIFYKSSYADRSSNIINTISKIIVYPFIISIGVLTVLYYFVFFSPIVQDDYDPSYLKKIKNDYLPKQICSSINLIYEHKKYCYPRLIVTEEEMAKISPAALYIPRHLSMKDINKKIKEQELILKHGTRIDLKERNLRYADLKSSILTRADMRESKFDAANLSKSHMQAVKLDGASFIDADLREAKLQSATLIGTQFQGASLVNANIQNVYFVDNNFTGASLQGAQLEMSFFHNIHLENVDLRRANLKYVNFIGANLTGASFHGAEITGAAFDKATLTGADFSGASIKNDSDPGKWLLEWNLPIFREAKMFGVNISKNKLNDTDLSLNDINLTTCQKQFIFDGNVSKAYLTFDERRIKYLHTGIQLINTQNPMENCKMYQSQESRKNLKKQLQAILIESCEHLKPKDFYLSRKREKIYDELMTLCR